jgi:molybdopterin-guanine dinucleotide biosynthesis protein A
MKTAIILSGGKSSRFNFVDKSFAILGEKALIQHVIDGVSDVVDEIIIVLRDDEKVERIKDLHCKTAIDTVKGFGPVAGILTGLEISSTEYSIVFGCDMPYVNEKVIELLFDLVNGYNAVIPRWKNGFLEPLYAVYEREPMINATREAIKRNKRDVRYPISRLGSIRYTSAEEIIGIEPKSFTNINMPEDLEVISCGE